MSNFNDLILNELNNSEDLYGLLSELIYNENSSISLNRKHVILNEIIETIEDKNIVIKYTDDNDSEKYLFLNKYNINNIRNILIYGVETENSINGTGSTDYMLDFIVKPIKNMQLYEYIEKNKKYNTSVSKFGKFFKYINDSEYILSRYQIYDKKQYKKYVNNDLHCILHAIEISGYDTINLRNFINDKYFSKKDLAIIAEKLELNISLYLPINDKYIDDFFEINKFMIYKYPKKFIHTNSIKIAIFKDHYFIHEKTGIYIKNVRKYEFTSLGLVCHLWNTGNFSRNHQNTSGNTSGNIFKNTPDETHIDLSKIITDQSKFEFKDKINKKNRVNHISFADTECIIRPFHKPFLYARWILNGNYRVFCEDGKNEWSGFCNFLNSFPKGYNIVYFHNLKYDWNVIKKCPHINVRKILKKDSMYYKIIIVFFGKLFELRDSYKIIPKKLSEFPKAFGIEHSKYEYILYELYTLENVKKNYVIYEDYDQKKIYEFQLPFSFDITEHGYTKNFGKLNPGKEYIILDNRIIVDKQILNICEKYFSQNSESGMYFHIEHCKYYIHMDCLILKQGVEKYRELMKDIIDIDCYNHLTLPSMVHKRVCYNDHYDNVYEVKDNLRLFISKSVQGGRVCSKDNGMWKVNGIIHNLDGKSLYPSSISRICDESGFPTGPAKVINDWGDGSEFSYYIVEVKILSVSIKQQIPFMSYLDKGGNRNYTNNMEGMIVIIDKITLEDWVEFQGITHEFIRGIYWDGIGNKSMGNFIKNLYDTRRKYIEEDNSAMNEICKLTLNSLFGKTLVKDDGLKMMIKDNKDIDNFITKNFDNLVSREDFANQSVFTVYKSQIGHSNMCHIGGMILSMARRIMNEVMALANELGVHILYTDTDSMHIVDELESGSSGSLKILENACLKKYSRILIGDSLGQFGFDFKYPGHTDIHSKKCIILGKKAYLDVVYGKNIQTGEWESYEYYRMKGVNSYAMSEYKDVGYLDIYERMYNGETINFDLAYGDGVIFDFKGDHVTTKDSYIVKIKFDGDKYT